MSEESSPKKKNLLKKFLPGIITGAADDDISGIVTYSQVGATAGFSQGWLLLLSTPLLIIVQGMCAKIGDITKMGLAAAISKFINPKFAFLATFILLLTNVATIAADFAGMASVLNMLMPVVPTLIFLFPVVVSIWYIVVFKNYRIIEKFLVVAASLLIVYIIAGLAAKPNWSEVLSATFIPKIDFNLTFFAAAVALLGTTIAPYLFFWQTAEEVEEHKTAQEGGKAFELVIPGMVFSNLIAFFVMITTAATFYKVGGFNLSTPAEIAKGLEPFAGSAAQILFAIGILGAGFLAIPVLAASSAYAFSEIFGWREGLSQKFSRAKGFYLVLSMTFLVSFIISATPANPIKMMFYSQILVGLVAPVLIALIVILASSSRVLGKYKNGILANFFGWLTVLVMAGAAIGFLVSIF